MQTKIISQDTSVNLIYTEDLQKQVETDEDDVYLLQLLDSAIDWAEGFTNRKLFPTEVKAVWEEYKLKVFLPYGEVTHVRALTAESPSGVEEDIEFIFSDVSEILVIDPKYMRYCNFTVTYVCGYSNKADDQASSVAPPVPQAIIHGLKMFVATMYENREDTGLAKKGVLRSENFLSRHKIRAV